MVDVLPHAAAHACAHASALKRRTTTAAVPSINLRRLACCHISAGHHALLQMRPCKGNLGLRGRITGTICAPDGAALYQLHGSICSSVLARAADGSGGWGEAFVVYQPVAWPEDWAEQFNMTRWVVGVCMGCRGATVVSWCLIDKNSL